MKHTLLLREVGEHLHVLNYSAASIMSFQRRDADSLRAFLMGSAPLRPLAESVLSFASAVHSGLSSRAFRSKLINLGMAFRFPTVANLELNRRCVLRCQHCYIPSTDLSAKTSSAFEENLEFDVSRLFADLHDLGVFLLVLTGGEVFINRRLRDILDLATRVPFVLEIFSSLQFLPEWFLELRPPETRIGRIQTSIYGVRDDIHDSVTQRPGSLARTLRNIDHLRAAGYYVEVATPLMKANFDHRFEIEEYFAARGVRQSFAWPIVDEYYGGLGAKSQMNVTKEQFLQFCTERPDYLMRIDVDRREASICAAGTAVLSVSANGDVFSCSQYPRAAGNLSSASVEDIYNSSEMRTIAGLIIGGIPADTLPYNYCIGNNYTATGDPRRQADVVREALEYYHVSRSHLPILSAE